MGLKRKRSREKDPEGSPAQVECKRLGKRCLSLTSLESERGRKRAKFFTSEEPTRNLTLKRPRSTEYEEAQGLRKRAKMSSSERRGRKRSRTSDSEEEQGRCKRERTSYENQREEDAQADLDPALEIPAEPDVKDPVEEENFHQASVDESVQKQFPAGLQDFRCCAVLGQGCFGKVLLAEYKQTKTMSAIKVIKKADVIERDYTHRLRYEKEIFQTVSSVHHPFLVNLFSSIQDEHNIFFVMEYAAGGDLLSNMAMIGGAFPEDRAVFYAACVTLGLEYLHQNKIVHRDLKLENVVLDMDGYAKLTDFGLSKAGIGFGDRTMSMVGTPAFMAPEMLDSQEYTRDVDWWSFGILVYLMLTAELPFDVDDEEEDDDLSEKIINAKVAYPCDMAPESISMISQLLVKKPELRLGSSENGAEDVKAHPFFRDIEWPKLLRKELRPPFQPPLSGPEDVSNFLEDFTSMDPVLTSSEEPGLPKEQQDVFRGFDWTAEWMP